MERITNIKAQPIAKKILDTYLLHPKLSEYLQTLDQAEIVRKLPLLDTYLVQTESCDKCLGLSTCLLKTQGLAPVLVKEQYDEKTFLQLQYQACRYRHQFKEQVNSAYLLYSHLPLRFFSHSMKELEIRPQQKQALIQLVTYLKDFPNGKKGVYLYGDSGCGKSYVLAAFTNEILARKIQCIYISMPEFVREMKNAIADGSLEKKVDMLKHVPILLIDDLGSEPNTTFTRDEILFPILDYRLLDEKPVFFASHMSLKSLEKHFSLTQKGDKEASKGKKITARISQLAQEILINE